MKEDDGHYDQFLCRWFLGIDPEHGCSFHLLQSVLFRVQISAVLHIVSGLRLGNIVRENIGAFVQ